MMTDVAHTLRRRAARRPRASGLSGGATL